MKPIYTSYIDKSIFTVFLAFSSQKVVGDDTDSTPHTRQCLSKKTMNILMHDNLKTAHGELGVIPKVTKKAKLVRGLKSPWDCK